MADQRTGPVEPRVEPRTPDTRIPPETPPIVTSDTQPDYEPTRAQGTEDLRREAESVADSAKREAASLRDEIAHEAREAAEEAKREAEHYADEQRIAAGESLEAIAVALQASVDSLRDQGHSGLADYWQGIADGAGDMAERIKDKPVGDLLHEAERYAREQPGLAFGGAMAAGMLIARFLKASSPTPPSTRRGAAPYDRGTPPYGSTPPYV